MNLNYFNILPILTGYPVAQFATHVPTPKLFQHAIKCCSLIYCIRPYFKKKNYDHIYYN
ncbi:hypothetical protein Hanom_Chr03g00193021 [Helianthus anomalus]